MRLLWQLHHHFPLQTPSGCCVGIRNGPLPVSADLSTLSDAGRQIPKLHQQHCMLQQGKRRLFCRVAEGHLSFWLQTKHHVQLVQLKSSTAGFPHAHQPCMVFCRIQCCISRQWMLQQGKCRPSCRAAQAHPADPRWGMISGPLRRALGHLPCPQALHLAWPPGLLQGSAQGHPQAWGLLEEGTPALRLQPPRPCPPSPPSAGSTYKHRLTSTWHSDFEVQVSLNRLIPGCLEILNVVRVC